MKNSSLPVNEADAEKAFSKQAPVFDALYGPDSIIQYKRKRVRDHVLKFLAPGSSILELNAGTGEDALFFAQQGHYVHATDISSGMLHVLAQKAAGHPSAARISYEQCSYTQLENLNVQGPYDCIFSNFAGLNCTNELDKVLDSFSWLLKPGGHVTLVLLPKFCLWESLLLFKGSFKTAFRRFSGKKGTLARVEGTYFRCWYYNPSFIKKYLREGFDLRGLEGLCTIVPPSYFENFAQNHPRLFQSLMKKENRWKAAWPWRVIGDYYIITLQKK